MKKTSIMAIAATIMTVAATPAMADQSPGRARVVDTSLPGTDVFMQNRDVARMMRKMEKSEIRRQNRKVRSPRHVRSLSPDSNRY